MEFLKKFLRIRKYNLPKIKKEVVLSERGDTYLKKEKNKETENKKHLSKLSYINDLEKYMDNENTIKYDLKNLRLEIEMEIRKETEGKTKEKVDLIEKERKKVQEIRNERKKELDEIEEILKNLDKDKEKTLDILKVAAEKIKRVEQMQDENILSAKYILELVKDN